MKRSKCSETQIAFVLKQQEEDSASLGEVRHHGAIDHKTPIPLATRSAAHAQSYSLQSLGNPWLG